MMTGATADLLSGEVSPGNAKQIALGTKRLPHERRPKVSVDVGKSTTCGWKRYAPAKLEREIDAS